MKQLGYYDIRFWYKGLIYSFGMFLFVCSYLDMMCDESLLGLETTEMDTVLIEQKNADVIEEGRPMTLDEVMREAFENNLDIKLARIEKAIKGTSLKSAYSIYDTYLDLEFGYTDADRQSASTVSGTASLTTTYEASLKKKLPTGTTLELSNTNKRLKSDSPFVDINPSFDSSTELEVTQSVLKNIGGMIDRGTVRLTKIDISKFDHTTKQRIEETLAGVEKLYWGLVEARKIVQAKYHALEKAQALLDINRKKLETGLSEDTDVYASEANLHLRQIEVLIAENAYEDTLNSLKLALYDFSDEKIVPVESLDVDERLPEEEAVFRQAFAQRRDYLRQKEDVEAKDINIKLTSNSRWPELDLIGSFALNGLDSGSGGAYDVMTSADHTTYYIGAEFSFNLENRKAGSEHEKARFEKQKSLIELEQIEKAILVELDEKLRNLKLALFTVKEAGQVEELQTKKLESEEKKLGRGRSNSFTVIDFQEDLIQAEKEHISARASYKKALVDLELAQNAILNKWGFEE
ncbi:MAG: TolC family protein [Candidatus Omnitrophica bacterium]|nr:TolC family protein [Candidatus Omnitrophota bacterium]